MVFSQTIQYQYYACIEFNCTVYYRKRLLCNILQTFSKVFSNFGPSNDASAASEKVVLQSFQCRRVNVAPEKFSEHAIVDTILILIAVLRRSHGLPKFEKSLQKVCKMLQSNLLR